jgi:hypothetical protein
VKALAVGVVVSTVAWVLLPWMIAAVIELAVLGAVFNNEATS